MRTHDLAMVPYRHWAWRRAVAGVVVLLSFVLGATAWAATPAVLVNDLNPQPYQAASNAPAIATAGGYRPYTLTEMGGSSFFAAWDEVNGTELWSLNSLSGAYALVKDINPGSAGSNPHNLISVNGWLFFAADDGSYGDELWTSDGTANGTLRVKDIIPGAAGAAPAALTNANGTLFFMVQQVSEPSPPWATYVSGSWELWKSDGTAAGTVRLKSGFPGYFPVAYQTTPPTLLSVGGMVFFAAETAEYGHELWKSDGTEVGTVLVKDINPGSASSYADQLTELNGLVLFSATDGSQGTELWKSDGTEAGTVLVKDINPGSTSGYPNHLTVVNNAVFFSADDGVSGNELWKSDGSTVTTQLVKDITPGSVGSSPWGLTRVNGTLFFIAGSVVSYFPSLISTHPLWKSDGTAAGTELVSVINPASGSIPENFTAANGTLFFTLGCSSNACPLWKSDGTAAGTGPLTSLTGQISSLVNISAKLFFSVQGANGFALWRSDGTLAGTLVVKPIVLGLGSSTLDQMTSLHGDLFFLRAGSSSGRDLWHSDGTPAGTGLIKAGVTNGPIRAGQVVFFSIGGTAGYELWTSDGTAAGTIHVKDFFSGDTELTGLTSVNGKLFFILYKHNSYTAPTAELWRSDGTPDGTKHISDFNGGVDPYLLSISDFTNVNGTLFFNVSVTRPLACDSDLVSSASTLIGPAASATTSYALWKSDGTAAGTTRVQRFGCSYWSPWGSTPPALAHLTNVQGTLFFAAQATGLSADTIALWKTDGTPAGTVNVAAVVPDQLTAVDRTLFFTTNDGTHGTELWKSDGTAAGTSLVKDILPGAPTSAPNNLTAVDRTLFFTASDGSHGTELWKSDSTAAGTALVKDIWPGPEGAAPTELADVNSTLAFRASDGVAGYEPWRSDGSPEGTAPIQDIASGSANSNPAQFMFAATQLFFTANDGITGRELWAIRSIGADIPSSGGQLSGWMDRTTYTFSPATFSTTAIVTHTMRVPNILPATGDRIQIGHAFEIAAVDRITGQALLPTRPYTITIQYTNAERGSAIADKLALSFWDGSRWVQEPSSRVDPIAHTITATPDHLGLWAILGETHWWRLPISRR